LNDFTNEFLVIVGELRTAADFFCPQPFQNNRGVAVATMRQLGLLGSALVAWRKFCLFCSSKP